MTSREYACASYVFACIAAHQMADAIRATDPDDIDRIVTLANAAQPDGIVEVAYRVDEAATSLIGMPVSLIFQDAYSAVNQALVDSNRARTRRAILRGLEQFTVDARKAAAMCMGAA